MMDVSESASDLSVKLVINASDLLDSLTKNDYALSYRVTARSLVEYFNRKISAAKTVFMNKARKSLDKVRKKLPMSVEMDAVLGTRDCEETADLKDFSKMKVPIFPIGGCKSYTQRMGKH